jgi:hypothetical protein
VITVVATGMPVVVIMITVAVEMEMTAGVITVILKRGIKGPSYPPQKGGKWRRPIFINSDNIGVFFIYVCFNSCNSIKSV